MGKISENKRHLMHLPAAISLETRWRWMQRANFHNLTAKGKTMNGLLLWMALSARNPLYATHTPILLLWFWSCCHSRDASSLLGEKRRLKTQLKETQTPLSCQWIACETRLPGRIVRINLFLVSFEIFFFSQRSFEPIGFGRRSRRRLHLSV